MSAAPAMSPSGEAVATVLDRATGARRAEADDLVALFTELTGEQPVVWAGRIIGFGEHVYRHDSGRSGVVPELAFASGSSQHTIYLEEGFAERWPEDLDAVGAHRASRTCLYVTRLSKVDAGALRSLLEHSLAATRSSTP